MLMNPELLTDPQALGQLHDEHYPAVYRYLAYRLGDPALSEDLAAETFLRLLDALRKPLTRVDNPRAWLLGTAHHLAMDALRRKYRRREEDLADHESLPAHHSPEAAAESAQTLRQVRQAMRRLTADQQHVLALRFTQELSLEETAQMMKKSLSAVKVIQFRALAALRRLLLEADIR